MATVELKLVPWQTPNFATVKQGPRPRQEGIKEAVTIPVSELSNDALSELAREWLTDLYKKAGKTPDWSFHRAGRATEQEAK